jgi:adenylate kinase
MDRGALVPDHVVIGMIEERLDRPDAVRGVILDGFPRTVPQAEALDVSLTKRHKGVEAALYVGVGEQELLRRLSSRWVCRAAGHVYNAVSLPPKVPGVCDIDGSELYQREDDRPETVKARLAQQLPPMYEVVDYYTGRGILLAVDGEQAVADVTLALLRAIEHDPGRSSAA